MNSVQREDLLKELDVTPEPEAKEAPIYYELCRLFRLVEISSKARHARGKKMILRIMNLKRERRKDLSTAFLTQMNEYLKTLSLLVADYESKQFGAGTVSASEMLGYLMRVNNLDQSDFNEEIGSQPIVSKVLRGDRPLKIDEIKKLSRRFNVSPEVFF